MSPSPIPQSTNHPQIPQPSPTPQPSPNPPTITQSPSTTRERYQITLVTRMYRVSGLPTTANTLKTHSTPRTTPLTSWPSTSTDVRFRRNRSSQSLRRAATFEATSTCFPPPVNNHRTKGTSYRAMTLDNATPSASIEPRRLRRWLFPFDKKG